MAPDLNSVPASPRPLASSPRLTSSMTASRRASQQMVPPAIPPQPQTLNILPSNQSAVNAASPPITSPSTGGPPGDNTGVGTGPGPLRHPRPLTAADLYLQLEKEQEAVVNRLTRELTTLRAAQNASVVSNASASSASTGLPDSSDQNSNHLLSGPSHPAPSQRRHHRSSSSTSTRSITGTVGSISTVGGIAGPRHEQAPSLSRQNSITGSSRRSGASSPAPSSSHQDHFPYFYAQRPSLPRDREPSSGNISSALVGSPDLHQGHGHRSDSITSVQTTGRYEETAFHRHELEAVKRENEALKRRIRDLERTLRARRQSDASRTRSESVSTTASVRGRERDEEEVVRVGESARSAGVPLR